MLIRAVSSSNPPVGSCLPLGGAGIFYRKRQHRDRKELFIVKSVTIHASALIAKLTSPFLSPSCQDHASRQTEKTAPNTWLAGNRSAPQSIREFAEAAIRSCRTLW